MRLVRKKRSPPSSAEEIAAQPWKILVIDDERSVHTLTKLILKRMEFSGREISRTVRTIAQPALSRKNPCPGERVWSGSHPYPPEDIFPGLRTWHGP